MSQLLIKKFIMKRFNYIPLLFLTLLLPMLNSCIDQKLEDCLPENNGIRIYFTPTAKSYAGTMLNPEEIKDIKLFIFDEKGNYLRTEHDAQPSFSSDYYMTLFLNPGIYTFVSWVNLEKPYNQNEYSTLEEMRVYIEKDNEDIVRTNPHALFQAYETSVKITDQKDQKVRLSLTQDINTINVKTKNFVPVGSNYQLTITARNGIYKFDNSFASNTDEVHYISSMQIGNDLELSGTQNILRLSEERKDPILKIDNPITGVVVYQAKLMELIANINANGTVIDIDNTHVYDILLTFIPMPNPVPPHVGITISINGWVVNEESAEL